MVAKSSDYLEQDRKDNIKKALLFFIDNGWKNKDEICELISNDFDVSRTAVLEIYGEIEKNQKPGKAC